MDLPNADQLQAVPAVQEINRTTQSLVLDTRSFSITSTEGYEFAGRKLTEVKAQRKVLDDLRKSFTRPLDQAKKAIMDFFRTPEERLDAAENALKRAMVIWSNEQERIRRAEQAKLEEQARKEREKLMARAEAAAAKGKDEKALELAAQASTVVAPIAQTTAPKVTGISFREVWKFEVVDPAAVPREYLTVDEQKIRKVVGALKGDTTIPGVRVWAEKAIAAGAA